MVLLLLSFPIASQNLIPNSGFETYSALPNSVSQWSLCSQWTNCASTLASPDYFHLDGSMGGDLPETPIAMVDPHEGSAVMGFAATGLKFEEYREYISVKLLSPLVVGNKYQFSFWFTNGEINEFTNAGLGTSDFGAYFSVIDPVQNNNEPIQATPQVKMNTVLYNREWVQISFNFYADVAAEHITIGVFGADGDKTINIIEGEHPLIAYYFIDDLLLEEIPDETNAHEEPGDRPVDSDSDPLTGDIDPRPRPAEIVSELEEMYFIPNAFTPDGDGINDVFRPVFPESYAYSVSIFDRWGNQIYWGSGQGSYWDGYTNGKRVPQDIYIWKIIYNDHPIAGDSECKVEHILEGSLTVIY